MKKSEKEALKKAFNIPEPQNKDSFAAKYEELIKKNERRLRFPVYTKYAATAVFAALVIGVWGRMTVSRDYVDKYRNGNLTSETAVVTTAEDTQTSTESVGENNNSAVTEASVQTAETAVQTQTVTTALSKNETSENTENNSEEHNEEEHREEPNEEEPQETSVQTAAVNTSVNDVTAVTTAEENTPPPPTTASEPVNHGQTTSSHVVSPKPVEETTTHTEYNPPPIAPQTTSRHDDEPVETTTPTEFDPSPPPPAMDEVDRRPWVIPSVKYEKSDNFINIKDLDNSCSSPSVDSPSSTDNDTLLGINELFERSKYIIKAEVIEKFYTAVDFHPYTQYDLLTTNCYKHDGKYPEMPSVYVPGGYMPADVYCEGAKIENVFPDGSVMYSDGGNKGETELYREYIFFIDDGLQSMPDGSYRLTAATDISIFAYDGEKYVSLGNPSLTFTEEELTYLT